MTNLNDYLPKATTWFSSTITYKGTGYIKFSNPEGWVKGEAICQVNELGEMTFTMQIIDPENLADNNDSNEGMNFRPIPKIGLNEPFVEGFDGGTLKDEIASAYIDVKTDGGGLLKLIKPFYYQWGSFTDRQRDDGRYDCFYEPNIKIYDFTATYTSQGKEKNDAKYWVLPCINLRLDFASEWQDKLGIRQHPLRIFPIPQIVEDFLASDISKKEKEQLKNHINGFNKFNQTIDFSYNDQLAFIERLTNYWEIIEKFDDGFCKPQATSIMVGQYNSIDDEDRPLYLLPVLGFATSCPVGASWIEFRDDKGNLVYRIHKKFGRSDHARLNAIIEKNDLPRLLNESLKSEKITSIHDILINITHAMGNIDKMEIFNYYIFTALDSLYKLYFADDSKLKLIDELPPEVANFVKEILETANGELLKIPNQSAKDKDTLNRFIASIKGLIKDKTVEKTLQFGDKVVKLSKEFVFSDDEISQMGNGDVFSKGWAKKVTDYRNNTMHYVNYSEIKERYDLQDGEILRTLLNLLIVISIKSLGYTGKYQFPIT